MAATKDLLSLLSFRSSMCSRSAAFFTKQPVRLCHIPVREPAPSLAGRHESSVSSVQFIARLPKLPKKHLLSTSSLPYFADRLQCASRSYSVLPQREIYTTPVWLKEDGTPGTRKCWNCNRPTDSVSELFFCKCGVVQMPAEGMTYFRLLHLDENFQIDLKKLNEMYIELQKRLHPDMFSTKSDTEQQLAEKQSALLNKAYFTLLKPLPRAIYILKLHGHEIGEGTTDMNPEFLMEILELNERIGESNTEDIEEIENEIASKIEENTKLLSDTFAAADFDKAQEIAVRLRYYVNVQSKVKAFYRDRM